MSHLKKAKDFKDYSKLVKTLESRGMIVQEKARAERKLAQIGYYRLSGFWYPCRQGKKNGEEYVLDSRTKLPVRLDTFQDDVYFDHIVSLYLFDKKLRQLMLDAIERVEIHLRGVIAHVMGFHDPLAYMDGQYINPKQKKNWYDKENNVRNSWAEWSARNNSLLSRSKEDCIVWHKSSKKELPFWVIVESWDFGVMSKYYEILNGKYQEQIAKRVGVKDKTCLIGWLQTINTLRNRCAHHTRIWNRSWPQALKQDKQDQYFMELRLGDDALKRNYGMIVVLWYMVRKIGPSSGWLRDVADLIDSKPDIPCCPLTAMGFPNNEGFPRDLFGLVEK